MNACARPIKRHLFITVLYRLLGIFLLFLSLGASKNFFLHDTTLVQTIIRYYPGWDVFVIDILIVLSTTAAVVLGMHGLLVLLKSRHASPALIKRMCQIESRLIRQFLDLLSILTRWFCAVVLALIVWFLLTNALTIVFTNIHYPIYETQPVVVTLGILGIVFLIESFAGWNNKVGKLFCVRCKI